jgi:putative hydrolase of the HAD superfamily
VGFVTDPKAILFDLDDTLIAAYGNPEAAWAAVAAEFSDELHPFRDELVATIIATGHAYWADPERSRRGRLEITGARRNIVAAAFVQLGLSQRDILEENLIDRLALRFSQYRDDHMYLFDDAHLVLDAARRRGVRLGLVTNGAGRAQRQKLERFDLGRRFDHIQIEGEAGFGKPDPRAFTMTLNALQVDPTEAWMVGDSYEADMVTPQSLGLATHWYNPASYQRPQGRPPPSRTISRLSDLLC